MALRVWLPLNGNLDNKGLSDINFIKYGNPTLQDGKIGQNYILDGSNDYFLTDNTNIGNYIDNYTISIWIKGDTDISAYKRICGRSAHKQYQLDISTAGKARFWTTTDGQDADGHRTAISSTTIVADNQWHHICGVNDGDKIYLYIDGILENSANFLGGYSLPSAKIGIGSIESGTKFKGMLADFRLYDEALSIKQIKEIAKGLVCHYKLTGAGANENLLKGTNLGVNGWYFNVGARYSKTMEAITWNGKQACRFGITDGDTSSTSTWKVMEFRTQSFSSVILEPSTNYIVSFDSNSQIVSDCKISAGNSSHNLCDYSSDIVYTISSDGIYHYKISLTTYASDNVGWTYDDQYLYMQYRLGVDTFGIIANLKLEKGNTKTNWIPHKEDIMYIKLGYDNDICTDVSGYGYTATKSGTLTFNTDSPRYGGSTIFNNGYLHYLPSPLNTNSDAFTYTCWFYPTRSGTMCLYNDRTAIGTGFAVFYLSGGIRFDTGGASNFQSGSIIVNDWNFIACVYDKNNTIKKTYINGVETGSTSTLGNLDQIGTNASIGNSSTNGSAGAGNQVYGSISDVRIYCTALSADDILTLYKTSGIIDNKGNVYSYEFVEE